MSDETLRHLALWFEWTRASDDDGLAPICEIRARRRGSRSEWVQRFAQSAVDASACAGTLAAEGFDVYLGALPRTREAGTADAVGRRVLLWADVDFGDEGHASSSTHRTREQALAAIESIGVEPSLLVETGGGLQVWYALTRAIADAHWHDTMERLRAAAAGDRVGDLPRILRVAGTSNHKYAPARPVRIATVGGRTPPEAFGLLPLVEHQAQGRRLRCADGSTVAIHDARACDRDGHVVGVRHIRRRDGTTEAVATLNRGYRLRGAVDLPFERAKGTPISAVLALVLGVSLQRRGAYTYCACPVHRGSNPLQMVVGGRSNVATCFGDCGGRTFTTIDVVAETVGCSPATAVDMIAEKFGFDGVQRRSLR